jgi:hypothetical protein
MKLFCLATVCSLTVIACQASAAAAVSVTVDSSTSTAPAPASTAPAPSAQATPMPAPDAAPEGYLSTTLPPPKVRHWYGDQVLACDGAALGLLLLAAATAAGNSNNDNFALPGTLLVGSGLTYLLGGPIVHFAHDEVGKGFGSLALRAGMPFALAIVGGVAGLVAGGSASNGGNNDGALSGLLIGAGVGFGLGIVGAIAIDAAALSEERIPGKAPVTSRLTVLPTFAPIPNGASFGVVGAF